MTRIGKAKRMEETLQSMHDKYYKENGPCCAGCDHWQWYNSTVGDCTRTVPVSGAERLAMIGLHGASIEPGAGHIMTTRDHVCGEFKDTYDWDSHGNL